MKGEQVERVCNYKYLGVTINEKLEWHPHASNIFSKMSQRMYFIRSLNSFCIDKTMIHLFYRATMLSVMSFCLTAWGGNTKVSDISKFNSLLKKVSKITNECPDSFKSIFETSCLKKLSNILKDQYHPLSYQLVTSQRSGRLRHIRARTERYRNSFMPQAIRIRDINYSV